MSSDDGTSEKDVRVIGPQQAAKAKTLNPFYVASIKPMLAKGKALPNAEGGMGDLLGNFMAYPSIITVNTDWTFCNKAWNDGLKDYHQRKAGKLAHSETALKGTTVKMADLKAAITQFEALFQEMSDLMKSEVVYKKMSLVKPGVPVFPKK